MLRKVTKTNNGFDIFSSSADKSRHGNSPQARGVANTICKVALIGCILGALFAFLVAKLNGFVVVSSYISVPSSVGYSNLTKWSDSLLSHMPPLPDIGSGIFAKQEPDHSFENETEAGGLPVRYRIAGGRSGTFGTFECIRGTPVFKTFVGDKNLSGISISGTSGESAHPERPCFPRCASDRSGADFSYNFPIRNGSYSVRLSLAEPFYHSAGQRIFSVVIEGDKKASIDIFAETQSNEKAFSTPYFDTKVEDGVLTVQFLKERDNAICNALEVVPTSEARKEENSPRAPLPQFLFCANAEIENVRVTGPKQESMPLSFVGNLLGNINLYKAKLTSSGSYTFFAGSNFTRYLQSSDCVCKRKLDDFSRKLSCSPQYKGMTSKVFEKWVAGSVSEDQFLKVASNSSQKALHCSIVSNRLYCDPVPDSHSDWLPFQTLILTVLRSVKVPNMEFYFDSSQQPVAEFAQGSAPVFGNFYSENAAYIPLPSVSAIVVSLDDELFSYAARANPWKSRKDSAYCVVQNGNKSFEMAITSSHTSVGTQAVSNSLSDILRAMSPHKLFVRTGGGSAWVPVFDVLSSGTVLVQPKVRHLEWIDLFLEAGKDYVEITEGKQTLAGVVQGALGNSEELRMIADNSQATYLEHFKASSLLCWTAFALHEYQKTLGFRARVRSGMEEVTQARWSCSVC